MAGGEVSWDELKTKSYFGRPHLVILGAGASLAALPDGDPDGNRLPLMNDLAKALDLERPLLESGLDPTQNFEVVYSQLAADPSLAWLREMVEYRVRDYFSRLRLPQKPTIYDYLVLSLRGKDYLATFNWDPFLFRACWRHHDIAPMPQCLYLHGSTIVGYCLEDRTQGLVGSECSVCGRPFEQGPLLYPVEDKDYTAHPYIDAQWKSLAWALEHAYVVTIFGYGAPGSDAAAIQIMKEAWGGPDKRNLEEIEIINVLPEEDLIETWSPFIHSHHYQVTDDYFSSLLGAFPRRTCEAMWEQLMEANFLEYRPVPRFDTMDELRAWAAEIRSHEKQDDA
ncbi:MAG: hypothetical protein EG823_09410 [Actinobacteria bacterium]|nr:hypothetical protein [Actinomycetota bacterium]